MKPVFKRRHHRSLSCHEREMYYVVLLPKVKFII